MTPDEAGNRHILVIIDAVSRYCYLVPIPELTAATAAQALIKFMGQFMGPAEIISDNGTQFVNQTVEHLLRALSTDHNRINAYSHEENGF